MKKPNFFIIGAPKCGTTALYEYLRTHPKIFLSDLKEPHFFADDYGDRFRSFTDENSYLERCFGDAREDHLIAGEASAAYLYSRNAVANIKKFNPAARLIVMLRNPVEMASSVHSQMVYTFGEDEKDFSRAWALQAERLGGRHIPKHCPVPAFLQYKEFISLGKQLQRAYDIFPRSQVKVIFFDDMKRDPGGVYRDVLKFLGVPDDGRVQFPVVNANKQHRIEWLAKSAYHAPKPVVKIVRHIKKLLGLEKLGIAELVLKVNRVESVRSPLSEGLRQEILSSVLADIELIEKLTGRDLSLWKGQNGNPELKLARAK